MSEGQTGEVGVLSLDQSIERLSLMEQGNAFAKKAVKRLVSLVPNLGKEEIGIIRGEQRAIRDYHEEYFGNWWKEYFNNFYAKLPNTNPGANLSSDRQTVRPKDWNVLFGQKIRPGSSHSEHYLSKTPAQFYQEMDQIIAEEGISVGSIQDLQDKQINIQTSTGKMRARLELYQCTLGVFIRLLLAGYNRFDLTV